MGAMKTKPWLLFVLLLILSYYRACFSIPGDTLSPGDSLSFSKSQTLLSQGSDFELGFFQPGTSLKIYLVIRYKKFDEKDIVWVANRENPLSNPSSSRLDLSEDGNLLLLQGSSNIPVWSTNLTFPGSNLTEAVLRKDGNFVLRERSNPSSIFWESFDHPTDVWLPGGKLRIDKVIGKSQQLISWKNSEDPTPGVFSMGLDPSGSNQICFEWNRSQIYWCSGLWDGTSFSNVPSMRQNYIYNFSFGSDEKGGYFTHSLNNPSYRSKFVMTSTGHLELWMWLAGPWVWNKYWSAPRDQSGVYALCGAFGVLYRDNSSSPACECLKGFEPFSMKDTGLNDWSGSCVRKSPLQCENNTYANATKDWFFKILNVRLPVNAKAHSAVSAVNCEVACMNNCTCTAYAYNSSGYCMIWEGALLNLQQLSDGYIGQDIYLKLAADERQNTKGKKMESMGSCAGPSNMAYLLPLHLFFKQKKAQSHRRELFKQ